MPTVEANGTTLWYEIHGELGGIEQPPLVLLHGYCSDKRFWELGGCLEGLKAAGTTIVVVEARGCGGSAWRKGGETDAMRQQGADVLAVLDAIWVTRFCFAGHSMGASVGILLATELAKDRVEKLILLAPTRMEGLPGWWENGLNPSPNPWAHHLRQNPENPELREGFLECSRQQVPRRDAIPPETFEGWLQYRIQTHLAPEEDYFVDSWDAIVKGFERARPKLEKLAIPTMIIIGSHDALFEPALQYHAIIPKKITQLAVLPRVDHQLTLEAGGIIATYIVEMLRHGPQTSFNSPMYSKQLTLVRKTLGIPTAADHAANTAPEL